MSAEQSPTVVEPEVVPVRRRPLRVSFSGLDGAGKSLQIDALLAEIGEQATVEVIWVPFKFWPERVKNLVPSRLRRRLRPEKEGVVENPDHPVTPLYPGRGLREKAAGGLRQTPWVLTGTVAAVSTALSLRQRVMASKADVVVLDRYRLDSTVKLLWQFPGVAQSWLTGIVRLLTPAPHLEVLLRLDADAAYARKADLWSPAQLREHAQLYDVLARGSRTVVTIDAERPPEDIAREVTARVRHLLDLV